MKYEQIQNTDSLGDTEFSMLFYAARTTSNNHYNSVSVPVKIIDNQLMVGSVVKTTQGQHYHVRGSKWDGVVSLSVIPLMDTKTAKDRIVRQLKNIERHNQAMEQRATA